MATRSLPAELRPVGLAGRIRGRPGPIALIGLVVLAISLVAGVTVGSIQIGAGRHARGHPPAHARARPRRPLDGRHGDDRLGAAAAAGPDGRRRRGRPRGRRRDVPGHRPQPARPIRTCSGRRRAPRSAPRSAIILPVGLDRLPVRPRQHAGHSSAPSRRSLLVFRLGGAGGPGGMTRLLLTGYAVGSILAALLTMAMYVSGREPAGDLLVPAGRPRGGLVGTAPDRGPDDPHDVPARRASGALARRAAAR